MFPSLTVVERAICLDHNPEKLGKHSESSLEWQPKPLSKYAHHDSRTEDAYLLCFHPSQSLKEPFASTMIRKSSESLRKAASNGSLRPRVSMLTMTVVQKMLTYCVSSPHSRRKSHFLRSYSYPNLESSESLRKATSNGSLRPRVSMLTMTVAQKMLTFCVSIPHSR